MSRATNEDLAMFAQVNANHPRLLAYLTAERDQSLKFVVQGRDPVLIHRYQGEVIGLEKIIKLLTGANEIIDRLRKESTTK